MTQVSVGTGLLIDMCASAVVNLLVPPLLSMVETPLLIVESCFFIVACLVLLLELLYCSCFGEAWRHSTLVTVVEFPVCVLRSAAL